MSSQRLKIKSKASMAEVVSHLENLVSNLKDGGQISISKNDRAVVLTPLDPVTLELDAEVKTGKDQQEKLTIELKWKKGEKETTEGGQMFIISRPETPAES